MFSEWYTYHFSFVIETEMCESSSGDASLPAFGTVCITGRGGRAEDLYCIYITIQVRM